MALLLSNAFSLNMLASLTSVHVTINELDVPQAARLARIAMSVVSHADTAAVFEGVLGVPIACNKATVSLVRFDTVVVGQYSGPRLPEGATTLPKGAVIEWVLVEIM